MKPRALGLSTMTAAMIAASLHLIVPYQSASAVNLTIPLDPPAGIVPDKRITVESQPFTVEMPKQYGLDPADIYLRLDQLEIQVHQLKTQLQLLEQATLSSDRLM